MSAGPIVIGFDGSPAAEHALREAGTLLAPRQALVVVVWEAGSAFDMATLPTADVGLTPVPVDIRTAARLDEAEHERAQRLAQHGTLLAKEAGFEAEGVAVADEITVAETLIRVAADRDAQALVVGAHGHSGFTERILGTTSQSVIRHAGRPVLVVRGSEE